MHALGLFSSLDLLRFSGHQDKTLLTGRVFGLQVLPKPAEDWCPGKYRQRTQRSRRSIRSRGYVGTVSASASPRSRHEHTGRQLTLSSPGEELNVGATITLSMETMVKYVESIRGEKDPHWETNVHGAPM